MKIAIHYTENTFSASEYSFNKRWITYCEQHNIDYKLVDAYRNDIITQLSDCKVFMWHFYQNSPKDFLFAKELLFSLHTAGKLIFPSINMAWHFDDKVGQKYLLETINAPMVTSNVFYDKNAAHVWANDCDLPVVFKLRGGAGSQNVKLLKTRKTLKRHINKAFGRGFSQYSATTVIKDRVQKYKKGNDTLIGVFKSIVRAIFPTNYEKVRGRDSGYIYFQKFIPDNDSDTRIIVVGNKAFGIKRKVRENDFRASGGGTIIYDKETINLKSVEISFEVSKKLNFDCVAFDFVFNEKNEPLIVEVSYGFAIEAYDACPGYWSDDLNWHEGQFNPQSWMIQDLYQKFNSKNN